MPYNIAADKFHTKKLCSRLSSSKLRFFTEIGRFAFFVTPFGGLRGNVRRSSQAHYKAWDELRKRKNCVNCCALITMKAQEETRRKRKCIRPGKNNRPYHLEADTDRTTVSLQPKFRKAKQRMLFLEIRYTTSQTGQTTTTVLSYSQHVEDNLIQSGGRRNNL